MSDIQVSIPPSRITIHLPELQANGATTAVAGSTRITQQSNTRVTRGGHTRVTRDFTVTTYPEMVVVSVPSSVITVVLPYNLPKYYGRKGR